MEDYVTLQVQEKLYLRMEFEIISARGNVKNINMLTTTVTIFTKSKFLPGIKLPRYDAPPGLGNIWSFIFLSL